MTVIHSIKLDEIPSTNGIEFTEAQWWVEDSPLVVVIFTYRGVSTRLRMDLGKQVFIDHMADEHADELVKELAPAVWDMVVDKRHPMETASP